MIQETNDVKTSLISRNVTVLGRRTSIRLEPEMWTALKDIAKRERCSIHDICSVVSIRKGEVTSLTAGIRVFVMLYYKSAATEEGHSAAQHGCFEHMKRRARITDEIMSVFSKKRRDKQNDNRGGGQQSYARKLEVA